MIVNDVGGYSLCCDILSIRSEGLKISPVTSVMVVIF